MALSQYPIQNAPRKMRAYSQAANDTAEVLSSKVSQEGLLKHLGSVLRREREKRRVIAAEISATLWRDHGIKKSEPSVSRFERGEVQPDHLEDLVSAYATALGVPPIEIWAEALKAWAGKDALEL